jgi:hypothetical protein
MNYFGKDSIARMVLYEMGLLLETRTVVCDNKCAMFLRV